MLQGKSVHPVAKYDILFVLHTNNTDQISKKTQLELIQYKEPHSAVQEEFLNLFSPCTPAKNLQSC